MQLSDTNKSPFIMAQATPSDPNEYGFYQADLGVQGIVALPHYLRLTAGPRVYVKRYFDYRVTLLRGKPEETVTQ